MPISGYATDFNVNLKVIMSCISTLRNGELFFGRVLPHHGDAGKQAPSEDKRCSSVVSAWRKSRWVTEDLGQVDVLTAPN